MKFLILSDLHFERHPDYGREFVRKLDTSDVDVIVLAGDICSGHYKKVARAFLKKVPQCHVIWIPGNHEYYGHHQRDVHGPLEGLDRHQERFHFLRRKVITIDGVKIAGCSLWFKEHPDAVPLRGRLNDFRLIHTDPPFEEWVRDENLRDRSFLLGVASHVDVVITHHAPSWKSLHPNYPGPFNHFFICDMEREVLARCDNPPKLWIHGHVHWCFDYHLGDTRVVANCMGYPGEGVSGFDPQFTVEVEARSRRPVGPSTPPLS